MTNKPLVRITWRDIAASPRWMYEDEALAFAQKAYDANYTTVGYLIYKDSAFVVMAATMDHEGGYNDVSMIPRAAIKRIEKLDDTGGKTGTSGRKAPLAKSRT